MAGGAVDNVLTVVGNMDNSSGKDNPGGNINPERRVESIGQGRFMAFAPSSWAVFSIRSWTTR